MSTILKFLGDGSNFALPLSRLLRKKRLVNVGKYAAVGDGHRAEQLAQLLVVPHGQLNVPRDDPVLLVVSGRISRQFEDLEISNKPFSFSHVENEIEARYSGG